MTVTSKTSYAKILDQRAFLKDARARLDADYAKQAESLDSDLAKVVLEENLLKQCEESDVVLALRNLTLRSNSGKATRVKRFLDNYSLYLNGLKKHLVSTALTQDRKYGALWGSTLELQDNSYGGDSTKYLSLVPNNMATNYHPDLFSLRLNPDTTNEEIDVILHSIDSALANAITRSVSSTAATYMVPREFSPLMIQSGMFQALLDDGVEAAVLENGAVSITFDRNTYR